MPFYDYETTDGRRVSAFRTVKQRNRLPHGCVKKLMPEKISFLTSPLVDLMPHPGDAMVKQMHRREEKMTTTGLMRQMDGMTPEFVKQAWSKPIPKEQLRA